MTNEPGIPSRIPYAHEYEQRIRIGVVGCGGQTFRNLFPSFQYAPVELMCTCDVVEERAAAYARQFGARTHYGDHRRMLERENLDAVLLAVGYDEHKVPIHAKLGAEVLQAGCHLWMEKPPSASSAEIVAMRERQAGTGLQVAVGFMKMFSTSVSAVKRLMSRPEFGRPSTMYLRDPEKLTAAADCSNPERLVYLLDHLVHPASVIHHLMGPVKRLHVEEGPDGEAMVVMKFTNGACGVLHMPWGQSHQSPMEQLEVVGQGANVMVFNNTQITYYRPGNRGHGPSEYGRGGDFTSPVESAPVRWDMEAYSGQPFNMHLFYQGYAAELIYFATSILERRPIQVGGLGDAWHILRLYEAIRDRRSTPTELPEAPAWTSREAAEPFK